MAKIIWHDEAIMLLESHISYALEEFGESTAMKWKKEIAAFEVTRRQKQDQGSDC